MGERIPTDKLRQIVEAALPGPWGWFGYPDDLKLATAHSGRRYVMDFVRKGFSGAQPRFQPGGRGMVPASELLKFEVGDQSVKGEKEARADGSVYRYDVRDVDCADARLIALAPALAAEVLQLREALNSIAGLGGNLTDEYWEGQGGPNDAGLRGGLLVTAMQVARAALTGGHSNG